jgi:hypothetical protein
MSYHITNTDSLEQLCLRDFGPYKTINTGTIPVSTNIRININEYVSEYVGSNQNKCGIANITLSGDWIHCNFIIGIQLITQLDKNCGIFTIDIGAIPYSSMQNYYLDVQVFGDAMITFDNVEFAEPVKFANSNINNPDSYYVKKINTASSTGINYLRFMSDCVGLAM